MGSRIRCKKTVKKLFECFMVIEPPWSSNHSTGNRKGSLTKSLSDPNGINPVVRSVFPSSYNDQEMIKTAAQFSFPCRTQSENVEVFTYVLTSAESKWTFGYCRHPPGAKFCTVFLTFLPWQEIFYRTLNFCAEMDSTLLPKFLETMYGTPVPDPGICLYIPTHSKPFICPCPTDLSLPSIPENRNVSEFYNALSTESMISLFAALLSERRIVVTSKKLSRLSSIVVASNLFLFPMAWQHIFIPVLPTQLQDYLSAPMPFLIGVPLPVWDRIPAESLGQLVRVDADSDTVSTQFPEDLSDIPDDVIHLLRKNLTGERVLGEGLARAFLRALAQIMGHYQDAFRDDGNNFDEELFTQFAHPSHRKFINQKLLKLQIFQQFIEERLEKVRNGVSESDEFELESLAWRSSRTNGKNGLSSFKSIAGSQNKAIKKAGKAVIMSVRKESGNLIESVKQNSTLKSAYRSVKEGGKNVKHKGQMAVSDIRSKFHVGHHGNTITSGNELTIGHTQMTKTYKRSESTKTSPSSLHSGNFQGSSKSLQVPPSSMSDERSSDANLIHLMSSSASASNLPATSVCHEGPPIRPPRLSKSEENLIDLDTPDSGQIDCLLGFTMENPLYEMATTEDQVFEEQIKTDAELLEEYGLNDYISQLNIRRVSKGNLRKSNFVPLPGPSKRQSGTNWTTFE